MKPRKLVQQDVVDVLGPPVFIGRDSASGARLAYYPLGGSFSVVIGDVVQDSAPQTANPDRPCPDRLVDLYNELVGAT